MFHKIKQIKPLEDSVLMVDFENNERRIFDFQPLIQKNAIFKPLSDSTFFNQVKVDTGGYGVVWSDEIDLFCDDLYYNGKEAIK